MSSARPLGQNSDSALTDFGSCLDAVGTLVPSRPVPSRTASSRAVREGLPLQDESPSLTALARELFQLLDSGVASCSDMRNGRPWPRPRVEGVRRLVDRFDEETCRQAAVEAREIVQSQDRAPNVTNLFAKKCGDIGAERQAIRDEIRKALA